MTFIEVTPEGLFRKTENRVEGQAKARLAEHEIQEPPGVATPSAVLDHLKKRRLVGQSTNFQLVASDYVVSLSENQLLWPSVAGTRTSSSACGSAKTEAT